MRKTRNTTYWIDPPTGWWYQDGKWTETPDTTRTHQSNLTTHKATTARKMFYKGPPGTILDILKRWRKPGTKGSKQWYLRKSWEKI